VSGTLLLLLVGRVIFDAWMTGLEIFLITDLFGEKLPNSFFNHLPEVTGYLLCVLPLGVGLLKVAGTIPFSFGCHPD
jgi:hypothetical protein